jgi:nitrate/nitrite transporter NarK
MDEVNEAAGFLLANPIFLIPVLLLAAVLVYAILKKLIKMALIVGIAGAMYVALMEYFGGGF